MVVRFVPPIDRFVNIVFPLNAVREPFVTSIPGAFASPRPSEIVLFENVMFVLP